MVQPRSKKTARKATAVSSDSPTQQPTTATPGSGDNTEEIEIQEESMQMRDKFSVNVSIDEEVPTELVYYYVFAPSGGGKLDVGEFLPPCRRLPNLQCKTPFYITYLIREVPVNSPAPGAVGTTEATSGPEHQNVLRPSSVVNAPLGTPLPPAPSFLLSQAACTGLVNAPRPGFDPAKRKRVGDSQKTQVGRYYRIY